MTDGLKSFAAPALLMLCTAAPAIASATDEPGIATRESVERMDHTLDLASWAVNSVARDGYVVVGVRAVSIGTVDDGKKKQAVVCGEFDMSADGWIAFAAAGDTTRQLFTGEPATRFCTSASVAVQANDYVGDRMREIIASDGL